MSQSLAMAPGRKVSLIDSGGLGSSESGNGHDGHGEIIMMFKLL